MNTYGAPDNAICIAPSKNRKDFSKSVSLPVNCTSTEKTLVKIRENCVYNNLAYNV